MQKFLTIYMDSRGYSKGLFDTVAKLGLVEEHLTEDLADGWKIKHVAGFGGMPEHSLVSGWFAVVLEKGDAEA